MFILNITDYIKYFGDCKLSPYNLRQSDILVLTALSYTNFSMVPCGFSEDMKLSEAIRELLAFGLNISNIDFLRNLYISKRFSDLCICGYRDEHDKLDHAMQFSAVTAKISENLWFISYSGTDGTIEGWKEDFQFSYLKQTPAQQKALNYLNEASESFSGNFIISGHSKGGNLAAYAAICAEKGIQKRINSVFCNDSPGFNRQSALMINDYHNITNKIHCIMPQDSIIGQLLNTFPSECHNIIFSKSESILMQHDIFNWQIDESGTPFWLPSLNPLTIKLMDKINKMINRLSVKQREKLTDYLFDALKSQDIHCIDSLKLSLPFCLIQ